jgi:ornithine cyclodeaminase/alanine dehydrogenase-like protein (mu-crystallin family)
VSKLRILNADNVRQALPMNEAIAAMKLAFAQLSAGLADVPLRSQVHVADQDGVTLIMPAYLQDSRDLAVKIVSVYPNNARRRLPTIHAAVLVVDADTGQPVALLEGGALTAIRTGAGSGAATELLARSDASEVAILGSGVQARTQLEAVCTVRQIRSVRVYSPNRDHAQAFAAEMAGIGPVPADVQAVATPAEAVAGADIICTATDSSVPVFDGADLKPGAHVNAVGSFTPEMQEVDAGTIRRALVVVDSVEFAMEEAGDLLIPIGAGVIDRDHIHAELGEIINGSKPGRQGPEQITYFKSCGIAVQDAAAASAALRRAEAENLGLVVPF